MADGLVYNSISGRVPSLQFRYAGSITVGPSGVVLTVRRPSQRVGRVGSDRGIVAGMSPKSAARLRRALVAVDFAGYCADRKDAARARGIFVTLTYPSVYSSDFRDWKSDLRAFLKRLRRRYCVRGWVWKLELQRRGAPHFHLCVMLASHVSLSIFRGWLSRSWYEVVGSEDPGHLSAGTNAVPMYAGGGLLVYLAKYLAKVVTGDCHTGRVWGMVCERVIIVRHVFKWDSLGDFHAFVRRLRRWGRGLRVFEKLRARRGVTLFGSGLSMYSLAAGLDFS